MKPSAKLLLLIVLLSTACTKVINVDLNSADPKLIIEAVVSDNTSSQSVTLTKSVSFSESNSFPPVSGATVIISDNQGTIDTLAETEAGKYTSSKITGKSGVTYSLYVRVEGKAYTAQSTMPNLVPIETMAASELTFFGNKGYYPQVVFRDPVSEPNYYRFVTKLNNKRTIGYNIFNDKFSNGNLTNRILSIVLDDNIPDPGIGDVYEVTMSCVDKGTYTYFYSLDQSQNGDTGAPDNPVTNINGGALGYFSAQADQVKTDTIK